MATATIFVELDTSSVVTGSKEMTDQLGGAFRTVQAQANTSLPAVTRGGDELSKSLNRLSSSRAPQFMGVLTSSVVSSIPALQGSATAMSLMSTAAFGLQRSLVALIGPTGFIILAVGALAGFTIQGINAKRSVSDLISKLNELTTLFLDMEKAGLLGNVALKELGKNTAEAEKRIAELKNQIELHNIVAKKLEEVSQGEREAVMLSAEEWKAYGLNVNKAELEIAKLQLGLINVRKSVAEVRIEITKPIMPEWMKTIPELVPDIPIKTIFPQEIKLPVAKIELKDILPDPRKAIAFAESLTDAINEAQEKLRDNTKRIEEEKKQAQTQAIQSISSDFESAFQQMLMGGKVAWDELIQYWYTKLLASAIFGILGKIFGFGGGGLFTSIFSFQGGTSFVPQTGLALLHKGEAVIPAERNPFVTNTTNNLGGNTYIIQIKETIDSKTIRTKLLPQLKRMSEGRELNF